VKVCTVLGARPQFVKASVVSRVLAERGHAEVLVDTGQHLLPAMAGDLVTELALRPPDHRLGVGAAPRDEQLARMTAGVGAVLDAERPDWVLVFGDTNSTLAGARAAAARRLRLAHVEAGLRSYDPTMPEERNRVETDRLSSLLLCPTLRARRQLEAEGLARGVHVVGDVMLDALLDTLARVPAEADLLGPLGLSRHRYVVATLHRVATTDDPDRLRRAVAALETLPWPVAFPVHPRTTAKLGEIGLTPAGAVRVLPPLGHAAMAALVSHARAVVTDSGGVQKEAYWLGVPCVTLRDETEWPETVEAGWNQLAGLDAARIHAAVSAAARPAARPAILGEPGAARRTVDLLETAR
jgi:UDP-GlcNAc3NAcA epimerase